MRSTKFQKTWIAAQALVLSVSLCAQQTSLPGQAPPPIAQASAAGQEQSKTVLFEGTAVHLRLTKELSSATAQVGDAVTFDTTEDVRLGDAIAIPKGSHALGKVTTVVPKRRIGRAGKLDLSIEYVRLPSGEKLSLSGSPAKTGGGHQGRMAGAMVATGIVVWPAAPLFLLMHGKDITIPVGQEVTVYTADDYDLAKANANSGTQPTAPANTNPPSPAAPPIAPASSPAPPASAQAPPTNGHWGRLSFSPDE